MIKNVQIIAKHSQVRELGNSLKYDMLRELIKGAATCQQLASGFGVSKQKIHYNLSKLLEENLIELQDCDPDNGKEVYYRATAKNYVLDFALGEHLGEGLINSRGVINRILESEYKIQLADIAARILRDSLKLRSGQKLLIVTGKYNLPLVEKILIEAGRMSIRSTVLFQDNQMLKAKYEEYSLAAFNADYTHFNRLLKSHDVYLNLNGEARFIPLTDPEKQKLRAKHYVKSHEILRDRKIRVAMMPGLLNDTLSDKAIESELQFWKALDIDFTELCRSTIETCEEYLNIGKLELQNRRAALVFEVENILAECGSFSDSRHQSPVINYPGGEVLMVPKSSSTHGQIKAEIAYALGERILKPSISIENGEIVSFSAAENEQVLAKAIDSGGADGKKIALICMGTNPNISLANIDMSFKQKSRGLVTVYWGDNRSVGGNVKGSCEWFLQLENPSLKSFKSEV